LRRRGIPPESAYALTHLTEIFPAGQAILFSPRMTNVHALQYLNITLPDIFAENMRQFVKME
jgi:hypothetical protein